MSGETVPYHLRQNKHVDRQLFVELLSHANRVDSIRDSLYISFGGVYFEDFKLVHQVFGTTKFLSIEREGWILPRQKHNKPYGYINCQQMASRELVNNLPQIRQRFGKQQVICWLDFADPSSRRGQLEDVSIFTRNAIAHDILRVTMNVNPATLSAQAPGETIETRDRRRLEVLRNKLSDMIPREIELIDVTADGFSLFGLELVKYAIQRALPSNPGLLFQPMGSYSYSDSEHRMLTVTGILLREESITDYLTQTHLQKFNFAGLEWQVIFINVPLLSQREKLALDQKIGNPKAFTRAASNLRFRVEKKPEKSREMLKSYLSFHRYYPHFHRVQY